MARWYGMSVARGTWSPSVGFPDLDEATQRRIGRTVHFALDRLWQSTSDAAPAGREDQYIGCCPQCCAPCVTLRELLEAGELDMWVRGWSDPLVGTAWWTDANEVDREWLARAWSRADEMGCHATFEELA